MVTIMRYIFFFSLLFLLSCSKSEFNFDFELAPDITENYNVTYYATDYKDGVTIQAVASVREGKCDLKGMTRLPTIAFITTRKSQLPLVVYAEKGNKIKVSGEDGDPLSWMVEGNDINIQLSDWRKLNIETLTSNDKDSVNLAVKEYVEKNPANPISTILMLCYYERKNNENGYSELMASLQGPARSTDLLHMLGRSDQLFHRYTYLARLESLVMRSNKEGADTLQANFKNPILLLFWQT